MRHPLRLFLPAVLASLLVAACGSSSPGSSTSSSASARSAAPTSGPTAAVVVKTAASSKLGKILVDSRGMTLYQLSGEQNGRFICTGSACVGVWHPVTAPASGAPGVEAGALGSVRRPDGTMQVTYKGSPLYTFARDRQPGDANGQGIKDVGIWGIITIGSGAPSTSSTPAIPAKSGGGYAY